MMSSKTTWIGAVVLVGLLVPLALAAEVSVPFGVECDDDGVHHPDLRAFPPFWSDQGAPPLQSNDLNCRVWDPDYGEGWMQHDIGSAIRGVELSFTVKLTELEMADGDNFVLLELRDSEPGTPRLKIRLYRNGTEQVNRLLITWSSDDDSGARHPQVDLPDETEVRVRWYSSTRLSPEMDPVANGGIAVWINDAAVPDFSKQGLVLSEGVVTRLRLGLVGGLDPGTSGYLRMVAGDVEYLLH